MPVPEAGRPVTVSGAECSGSSLGGSLIGLGPDMPDLGQQDREIAGQLFVHTSLSRRKLPAAHACSSCRQRLVGVSGYPARLPVPGPLCGPQFSGLQQSGLWASLQGGQQVAHEVPVCQSPR